MTSKRRTLGPPGAKHSGSFLVSSPADPGCKRDCDDQDGEQQLDYSAGDAAVSQNRSYLAESSHNPVHV
jgi:hypothetical protein